MEPKHDGIFATRGRIRRSIDVEVQTVLALLKSRAIWIVEELLSQFLGPTRASELLDARRLNSLSSQWRGPWRCWLRWAESLWW